MNWASYVSGIHSYKPRFKFCGALDVAHVVEKYLSRLLTHHNDVYTTRVFHVKKSLVYSLMVLG